MDPTIWAPTGGVAALLAISVGVVMRVLALYGAQIRSARGDTDEFRKQTEAEIYDLKRANQQCEWRVALLVWTMQQNGLHVPDEIFVRGIPGGPPPPVDPEARPIRPEGD